MASESGQMGWSMNHTSHVFGGRRSTFSIIPVNTIYTDKETKQTWLLFRQRWLMLKKKTKEHQSSWKKPRIFLQPPSMISTQRTTSSQIWVNTKGDRTTGQLWDFLCAELNGFNILKTCFMGVKRNTKQLDLREDTTCLEPLGVADVICFRSEPLSQPRIPSSSVLTR